MTLGAPVFPALGVHAVLVFFGEGDRKMGQGTLCLFNHFQEAAKRASSSSSSSSHSSRSSRSSGSSSGTPPASRHEPGGKSRGIKYHREGVDLSIGGRYCGRVNVDVGIEVEEQQHCQQLLEGRE